jgi:hypothetical protein
MRAVENRSSETLRELSSPVSQLADDTSVGTD